MERRAEGAWVVTGAASGFGREAARRLVEGGARVALLDRDAEGLDRARAALGDATVIAAVDVTDPDAVSEALARAADAVGPIAHVFHSAGVLSVGPAEEVPSAAYRRMLEVNALGSIHVATAALPHLRRARGRATLTLVASVAGLRGFPQLAGYSASKFAVLGFAQALSDELAGESVQVKVLCPPPGDTPMVRDLATLPPIYKLSPLFTAEQIVDAWLRDLDRPGLVGLVDARSKVLHRVARHAPGVLDLVVRLASR